MALQPQKNKPVPGGRALLVIFLIASVALTTVYAREGSQGPLHSIQNVVSDLVTPFKLVGASVDSVGSNVGASLDDITTSDGTKQDYEETIQQLSSMYAESEEKNLEAERLRELLGLRDTYARDSVAARVVGNSMTSWNDTITIDQGTDSGVKEGLPVMGASGLIGHVSSASKNTAQVRLLTDSQSSVSVMIQSSRAEGIVKGSVTGLLTLEYVDLDVEVQEGDVIITSGLGGTSSKGLMVGIVAKVEHQGDASRKITIAPNAKFISLEEVLVIFEVNPDGINQAASTNNQNDGNSDTGNKDSGDGTTDGDADGDGDGEGGDE